MDYSLTFGQWTRRFWIPVPVMATRAARGLRLEHRLRFFASLGLIVGMLVMGAPVVAQGAETVEPGEPTSVMKEVAVEPGEATVVMKEVVGEVGVVRPHYLTVVYAEDLETRADYEMMFPVDETVALINRTSLDDYETGNQVRVTYEEHIWMTPDGQEKSERRTTSVQFLSSENTGLGAGQ